jgi:hypothetical protein
MAFGKRNDAAFSAAAPAIPVHATAGHLGLWQQVPGVPLSLERLQQSIKEDAHFFDPNVDAHALMKTLENNPYVMHREQARRLNAAIIQAIQHRPDLRIEIHMGILGSLAGWTCLTEAHAAGVRYHRESDGKIASYKLDSLKGADGATYFFGKLIDEILLERDTSIWKLTGNEALRFNPVRMPDMEETWSHIKTTFQRPEYGIPRYPMGEAIAGKPIEFVREFWSKVEPVFLNVTRERLELHQVLGFAIQEAMHNRPEGVDAGFLAAVVMECALPMAHIHPEDRIFGGRIPSWRPQSAWTTVQ